MTESSETRHEFGVNPKDDVFKDLAAVVYAAEGLISGTYTHQSRFAATLAEAHCGGLRGKRIIDMGCGYGTTTAEIARHCPAMILGVDASPQMIDLYREVFALDGDIRAWLRTKGAEALGPMHGMAASHLENLRRDFKSGAFSARGGRIQPLCRHLRALALRPEWDAVVGNNFFHWPVNEEKASCVEEGLCQADATDAAIGTSLTWLGQGLRKGGVAVLLEPLDFVSYDDDPSRQAFLEARNPIAHPIATAMQEAVNRILAAEHGVTRPVLRTSPIFRTSAMKGLFDRAGFDLIQTAFSEITVFCDPVDAFMVRMPMWLGSVDLPFETKIAIAARANDEVHEAARPEDLELPLHSECTVFVARKL